MSEKPVPKSAQKPDLDFVRYADDIQRSTSLKKYIESGKEQRDRLRKRTKDRVQTSDLSYQKIFKLFRTLTTFLAT